MATITQSLHHAVSPRSMKIGLFIPCYIDLVYSEIGSVAIHNSCSSIRRLGIAKPSEIMGSYFNKTEALVKKVKGLVLVPVDRPDDYCGFGGTFCVTDEAVSARMGLKKERWFARLWRKLSEHAG